MKAGGTRNMDIDKDGRNMIKTIIINFGVLVVIIGFMLYFMYLLIVGI